MKFRPDVFCRDCKYFADCLALESEYDRYLDDQISYGQYLKALKAKEKELLLNDFRCVQYS